MHLIHTHARYLEVGHFYATLQASPDHVFARGTLPAFQSI